MRQVNGPNYVNSKGKGTAGRNMHHHGKQLGTAQNSLRLPQQAI